MRRECVRFWWTTLRQHSPFPAPDTDRQHRPAQVKHDLSRHVENDTHLEFVLIAATVSMIPGSTVYIQRDFMEVSDKPCDGQRVTWATINYYRRHKQRQIVKL